MAVIIDRRPNGKKNAENRKKFLDRYRDAVKDAVQNAAEGKGIKDFDESVDVTISGRSIREPHLHHDPAQGERTYVIPGNTSHRRGDELMKPEGGGQGGGSGNQDGDDTDEFTFTLTKEEFLDIYFGDMKLPDFIKESEGRCVEKTVSRAGFAREGIPARLDIMKTYEQYFARTIGDRDDDEEEAPAIDDVDIRYKRFEAQPKPKRKAVMFCLMDVSGSMREEDKEVAKKFFIYLYLFLERNYKDVDLRFIRYTTHAEEVDEQTFFYDKKTGGTVASEALKLTRQIIEESYPLDEWNIYICHAADGDTYPEDVPTYKGLLRGILDLVQYYAYVQVRSPGEHGFGAEIYKPMRQMSFEYQNLGVKLMKGIGDVLRVFRGLFEKNED